VSGPVFTFSGAGLVFGGTDGVGSRFHVLCSRTSFQWSVCVGSCFHILRALTRFWGYRGRRVPFSSFARSDSFSTVPRVSGPVFTFCAPGHIFGGAECVGSCFHILRARIRFRWYRRRRVPFSCFAIPDSFSAVPRASGPIFLRSRTHFRRCQVRRVPFSRFACSDSFLAVPMASRPVFKFCAPGLVFGGTEGVGSRFQVLRSRTNFWRC
jgi:hypothetical protein